MNSSYNQKDIDYGDLIDSLIFMQNPKFILEIGILDGYSLKHFIDNTASTSIINAYDIFDKFNGNHANESELKERFKNNYNVSINYGDFYLLHKDIDMFYDIIHIDIANNGDIYEYAIQHYLPKLTKSGIMILEGGSLERDNINWMIKYNKPPIKKILNSYEKILNIKTIGCLPSITIIKK
jgi:predicted O-methyltransferase YrrM